MASMRDGVVRLPDGTIELRLALRERAILRSLLGDLRDIVGEEADPPGLTTVDADEAPADHDVTLDPDATDGVSGAATDPVLTRLYPDARPDDPAWSARFRDMIRGDLDDARRESLAIVEDTLDARSIDDDEAEAWLHVLNDLRLVMGTRLDITEEREAAPFDPEAPDAAARVVYAYTGWLEGQFVDVLAAALPEAAGEREDNGPSDASADAADGFATDDS
ncbi:MAG TPA: DUF2017 family protein [Candidatus Limnocylindrales bacterium]|jgi:hypothetical protein